MGSYFLLSLWFPEPPCDPGQSDFPNPVLTLVSLYTPFRTGDSLSAGSHTPLSFPICLWTRFARGSALPGSVSRCPLSSKPPSAQSPFARLRRYLSRRDLSCIASEGATPPSSLLRAHAPDPHPPTSSTSVSSDGSLQVVTSPCWMLVLPDVISACLSLDTWPHTPASPLVLSPVSSQRTPAFPPA